MIRFFDTYSGKLKDFDLPAGSEVKMYTCGPTVYDYAHIGNFRTFVFEDLLRRFLEFKGYQVKHVMNITDVDDKTIAGANQNVGAYCNTPLQRLKEYASHYEKAFLEDLDTLNIKRPHIMPHAADGKEIKAMQVLVSSLMTKGYAYEKDGSIYYRVSSFKDYGKLSKKDLTKNITGARVDVDEYDKEEGADFALWKKAKENEPAWDSPWGKGRPGWHLECSSMSMNYLGETFDIHAGGEDLIFPHHENEIAQSEAATGKKFVNFWLHAKHLLVNGEKMSKSKGNFYTLRDLLAKNYDPMAIRYALLSTHYRSQLNFTLGSLEEAKEVIKRLDDCYWECFNRSPWFDINNEWLSEIEPSFNLSERLNKIVERMSIALNDDLNISLALVGLYDGIKEINRAIAEKQIEEKNIKSALGFFERVDFLFGLNVVCKERATKDVVDLFYERQGIRGRGDFMKSPELQKQSDNLRAQLHERGWTVKDGRPGEWSTVKKKRRTWD